MSEEETKAVVPEAVPQEKEPTIEEKWLAAIKASNGQMLSVPESLKEQTNAFNKSRKEYTERAREFDKLTAEFDNFSRNFWFEMRSTLFAEGHSEVFSKNIGFNQAAKEDEVNVINLLDVA